MQDLNIYFFLLQQLEQIEIQYALSRIKWTDERNWYKRNPSLDHTIDIEKVRNVFNSAKENPEEKNIFRQLRLNQWVKQFTRWMQFES